MAVEVLFRLVIHRQRTISMPPQVSSCLVRRVRGLEHRHNGEGHCHKNKQEICQAQQLTPSALTCRWK